MSQTKYCGCPVGSPCPHSAMSDVNSDYSPMLGHNLLPDLNNPIDRAILGDINPMDGPPKNDKEYGMYRDYYEGVMRQSQAMQGLTTEEGFVKFSAGCEFRDRKLQAVRGGAQNHEGHKGCNFVMACHHVYHCDPVNPDPVYYVPFNKVDIEGYYLCKSCFKALEKYRLNLWRDICVKCSLCIGDAMTMRVQKNPELFIDLRLVK